MPSWRDATSLRPIRRVSPARRTIIVSTILDKIEAAKVFAGDVTPIAVTANGKALANPNVLIGLGYAKRGIGLERVTTLWNTSYAGATIEQLPFDMRGRRGRTSFHLSEGALTADLRTERDKLRSALREALRASIAVAVPGVQLTRGELDSYETARASELEAFIGRLWINWGAGARSWVQRPDRQNKPIVRLWKRKLQSRAMGLNKN